MDHDDDGETSYNTFVDDVAFEPTYSQALLTTTGRNDTSPSGHNVATIGAQRDHFQTSTDASSKDASLSSNVATTAGAQRHVSLATIGRNVATLTLMLVANSSSRALRLGICASLLASENFV